jgi:hypothetical protein
VTPGSVARVRASSRFGKTRPCYRITAIRNSVTDDPPQGLRGPNRGAECNYSDDGHEIVPQQFVHPLGMGWNPHIQAFGTNP